MKSLLNIACLSFAMFAAFELSAATQYGATSGSGDKREPPTWEVSYEQDGVDTFYLLYNDLGTVDTGTSTPRTDLAYFLERGEKSKKLNLHSEMIDLSDQIEGAMEELAEKGKAYISAGAVLNEGDVLSFYDGPFGDQYDVVASYIGHGALGSATGVDTYLVTNFFGDAYDGDLQLGMNTGDGGKVKMNGQPLPGVMVSLLFGAGAALCARRRLKKTKNV